MICTHLVHWFLNKNIIQVKYGVYTSTVVSNFMCRMWIFTLKIIKCHGKFYFY